MSAGSPFDLSALSAQQLCRLLEICQGRSGAGEALSLAAMSAADLGALVRTHPGLVGQRCTEVAAAAQAALAEREAARPVRLDLVWTGPEAKDSAARDTAVAVRELLATAQHRVLLAGYRFDHPEEVLAPLHAAMVQRGVEASIFLDVPHGSDAAAVVRNSWPFPGPRPRFFTWKDGGLRQSLHAKCAVADGRTCLIGSANFTDRGQTRNIELGVLVRDEGFAQLVEAQWAKAVAEGEFEERHP